MIDVTSEQLILPAEVSPYLPKSKGKSLAVSTVYRWFNAGIAGVRLEYICIAGTRYTSKEALNRFFRRVTEAKTGIQQPLEPLELGKVARKQAEIDLQEAGF